MSIITKSKPARGRKVRAAGNTRPKPAPKPQKATGTSDAVTRGTLNAIAKRIAPMLAEFSTMRIRIGVELEAASKAFLVAAHRDLLGGFAAWVETSTGLTSSEAYSLRTIGRAANLAGKLGEGMSADALAPLSVFYGREDASKEVAAVLVAAKKGLRGKPATGVLVRAAMQDLYPDVVGKRGPQKKKAAGGLNAADRKAVDSTIAAAVEAAQAAGLNPAAVLHYMIIGARLDAKYGASVQAVLESRKRAITRAGK